MSNKLLINLAASMRAALSTPVEAATKEDQKARLDIIDMIPQLQRKLVGDRDTIRNMTWSVRRTYISCSPLTNAYP